MLQARSDENSLSKKNKKFLCLSSCYFNVCLRKDEIEFDKVLKLLHFLKTSQLHSA